MLRCLFKMSLPTSEQFCEKLNLGFAENEVHFELEKTVFVFQVIFKYMMVYK